MLTLLLACSAVVSLIYGLGAALLALGARRAPVGYEDETGFHRGAAPVGPAVLETVLRFEYDARPAAAAPAPAAPDAHKIVPWPGNPRRVWQPTG